MALCRPQRAMGLARNRRDNKEGVLIQRIFHNKSYIYRKYDAILNAITVLYHKYRPFLLNRSILPPPSLVITLFLVAIVAYCSHQNRQLDQMVSINICLRHTIHKQHDTLHEQKNLLMDKTLKVQDQTVALLEKDKALQELTHHIRSMTAQVTRMHQQTTRLATLEEQIRTLARMEPPAPQRGFTGMGGTSRDLFPRPYLSLDRLPGDDLDTIQKAMDATQQQLTHRIGQLKTLRNELELQICTPSIKPATGVVSCGFGERLSPFSGAREFHTGVDIAAPQGTRVVASARGTVIFARNKWLIGNLVIIDHGNGITTKYGHLDKFLVKKGDVVNRGDVIGLMGNTGKSTGPHVHYEVLVNGQSENPTHYFSHELATAIP